MKCYQPIRASNWKSHWSAGNVHWPLASGPVLTESLQQMSAGGLVQWNSMHHGQWSHWDAPPPQMIRQTSLAGGNKRTQNMSTYLVRFFGGSSSSSSSAIALVAARPRLVLLHDGVFGNNTISGLQKRLPRISWFYTLEIRLHHEHLLTNSPFINLTLTETEKLYLLCEKVINMILHPLIFHHVRFFSCV